MTEQIKSSTWKDVASPFCGIACDDLKINVEGSRLSVVENGCAVNTPAFEQEIIDTEPRIKGKKTCLDKAIEAAATILRDTALPLIAGLATDVNGMRAALSLADRCGAVVDNMNSSAAMRNILALQNSGWMNTTLAEVKNRVDLLLVIGADIEPMFPRFFERYIWNKDAMFVADTNEREVVYVGCSPSGQAAHSPNGHTPEVLDCGNENLPEVAAAMRVLAKGHMLQANEAGGIAVEALADLVEKLRNAKYSVITWAAGALDYPNAELTVQMVCQLIKDLNEQTRCSGLPLGGKEGDQTANQVCGWQTGYPVRTRFSAGFPEYDPYLNATDYLLDSREADALLWVSAFDVGRGPPKTQIPTIVLGRSGMTFDQEPDVFIPIGTPGIDHAGHAYRTDNVVAMRLRKLRDTDLPNGADVLTGIAQAL